MCLDGLVKENGCAFVELFGVFGSIEGRSTTLTYAQLHFGMVYEIVFQTVRNIIALWYDFDSSWHICAYLIH